MNIGFRTRRNDERERTRPIEEALLEHRDRSADRRQIFGNRVFAHLFGRLKTKAKFRTGRKARLSFLLSFRRRLSRTKTRPNHRDVVHSANLFDSLLFFVSNLKKEILRPRQKIREETNADENVERTKEKYEKRLSTEFDDDLPKVSRPLFQWFGTNIVKQRATREEKTRGNLNMHENERKETQKERIKQMRKIFLGAEPIDRRIASIFAEKFFENVGKLR